LLYVKGKRQLRLLGLLGLLGLPGSRERPVFFTMVVD
jgi:hypothetical protein